MKYKGILLFQGNQFVVGDDFLEELVIADEDGTLLSNLTGWTFRAELHSLASSITNTYITITTSGSKATLSIPNSATEDLTSDIRYVLIVKGKLDSKDYTLVRKNLYFKKEVLDWKLKEEYTNVHNYKINF